jgi:5'-nucleotidase
MSTAGIVSMQAAGNHEFDLGPSGLSNYLDKINFPFRSHNVDVSLEPQLNGPEYADSFYPNGYELFTYQAGAFGKRETVVAVIGITTESTPITSTPGPNVLFRDAVTLLQQTIPELKRTRGVDHVIVVSHSGIERDIEIAQQVDGIALIVGGHSHTLLEGGRAVTGPSGDEVLIVQVEAFSKYLGETEVCWSAGPSGNGPGAKALVQATPVGEPISLYHADLELAMIPEQPAIAAIVDAQVAALEVYLGTVIGSATARFEGRREFCRSGDCAAGLLIARAFLATDFAGANGAAIGFQNGGGTRSSIDGLDVTVGDVLTVAPFQNELAAVTCSGQSLVAALENGYSQVTWNPADSEVVGFDGRFPQLAGIAVTWDPSLPSGARVVSTVPPIDPTAEYTLIMAEFVANGGDGYAVFRDQCSVVRSGPLDADAIQDFVAANSPLDPETFGPGSPFAIEVLKRTGIATGGGARRLSAADEVDATAGAQPAHASTGPAAMPKRKEIRSSSPPLAVKHKAVALGGFPCVMGARGRLLVWGICGAAPGEVLEHETLVA